MAGGTRQQRGGGRARAARGGAIDRVAHTAASNGGLPGRLARAAATRALRAVGRRVRESGLETLRRATSGVAALSENGLTDWLAERRLPIQVCADVAVPIEVAWEEWGRWGTLPEGVHRIEGVERDGDRLTGRTSAPHATDWEAEITDERANESFAWRSSEGSDCAGLVTFHRISDRLTRIELDLDVLPTSPSEGLSMTLHLAHHRAMADLRRFKAHVEFISPDAYSSGRAKGRRPRDADGADDGDAADA